MYFPVLCYFLGGYLLLASLWLLVTPDGYRNLARRWIPEKRPAWFLVTGAIWTLLVVWTWWKAFEAPTAPALIVAAVLSLSMIKIAALFFNYAGFRIFAGRFLDCPNGILRTLAGIYLAMAGLLIALGIAWG